MSLEDVAPGEAPSAKGRQGQGTPQGDGIRPTCGGRLMDGGQDVRLFASSWVAGALAAVAVIYAIRLTTTARQRTHHPSGGGPSRPAGRPRLDLIGMSSNKRGLSKSRKAQHSAPFSPSISRQEVAARGGGAELLAEAREPVTVW